MTKEYSKADSVDQSGTLPTNPDPEDSTQHEHVRGSSLDARLPATFDEWKAFHLNGHSSPRTMAATEDFLDSLTPDEQRRIDHRLQANARDRERRLRNRNLPS